MEPFYTRQIKIINRQVQLRDEQRGRLRSIGKGFRKLWKNLKKMQSKPKKIVDDSHNTEESVATADATKSLEASESIEELRNQPKPADTKKADQRMEEAHPDLESMPDDEIMFVSRNDDEDDDSKELFMADEIAADNLINKLISVANTRDANTNVFAATDLPISTVSASTSTTVTSPRDVQALIVKAVWEKKNIPRVKIPNRFVILQKKLSKSMREIFGKYVMKNIKREIEEVNGLLGQCAKHQMQLINYIETILHSSVKVPWDILVVDAKHLKTKVEKTSADLHELVELVP
ncbi:hypothetical protein Tco_0814225 [Tanacetum coccineum]